MPRALQEQLAHVSGGGMLGIGLSCGFCIGLITYACVMWLIRACSGKTTHNRSQSKLQNGNEGNGSAVPDRLPEANIAPYAKPPTSNNDYFSPLQSSIAKSVNLRNSANSSAMLETAAAFGGHGFAVLHVSRPTAPSTASAPSSQPPSTPLRDFNPIQSPSALDASEVNVAVPPGPAPVCDTQVTPVGQRPPAAQHHQRLVSVADAYAAQDLDDEWAVVLGDLDGMLAKRGQPRLASPERAVAVRRLIAVTGSRGMHFALEAALQDVLRVRSKQ
ncbi:hypothetical protein Agub_g8040 [Astrephomene gubernaculifera]|uniref:Uncharacterized protein n=1 Tax=Astrephomene gubernaculifera TaxID=47775 RepID=A0AAD3DSR2_9CHLO|nr:hypothetical protein Agub_g8040 [Astrephomene gubernaculifera]